MSNHRDMLDAALRENFYIFLREAFAVLNNGARPSGTAYLEALACTLQSAIVRPGSRQLITMPPRHLKSIAASVALPAWLLGRDPRRKIMVASYGEDLARELTTLFQRLITSSAYRRLYPHLQIASRDGLEIRTTAGGGRKAVFLGGATTGFGADLIVVDDLMKAQEASSETRRANALAYFQEALLSRFNNPAEGVLIVVQQRLHEDDLPAQLLGSGAYEHFNLPAKAEVEAHLPLYSLGRPRVWIRRPGDLLDPERLPQAVLDARRAEMGGYAFSAQYQQNPVPPEGALIRMERLNLVEDPPLEAATCLDAPDRRVIQSWDTAIKDGPTSDYSVSTTWVWYRRTWYLADLLRVRLEFPELKDLAKHQYRRWRPHRILIEEGGNGSALCSQLRSEGYQGAVLIPPRGSKIERVSGQLDLIESTRVALPTRTSWWPDLAHELRAFPNGRYDDQVDAVFQFLAWIRGPRGERFMNSDPVTGRPYGLRRPLR